MLQGALLHRLVGTETEYALRFSPDAGGRHPGNEVLYEAIRRAVAGLVHTRPGQGIADAVRRRVFTENGGSFYYECVPGAPDGGLVEGGTPECRGPGELLVYQRAQDLLLTEAVGRAEQSLRDAGIPGTLALLKNCRDAFGHVYGAQESYDAEIASGAGLAGWWASVLLALPFALGAALVHWLLLVAMLAAALPIAAVVLVSLVVDLLAGRAPPDDAERLAERWTRVFDLLGSIETGVAQAAMAPPTLLAAAGAHLFAWRRQRRALGPFLASRCILTGAGTLTEDGAFHLSEKVGVMRRTMRWSVPASDRGMLEIGHLVKPLYALTWLDWRGVVHLFRRRQRLQIGLSDANLCQEAELLKIGTTALVLDLVDAGLLDDGPRLADPVAAARTLAADPTLTARVPLAGGGSATALELQREFHARAAALVATSEPPSLEARRVVERWGEVLDLLEHDPDVLVGRVDWITKRRLLDEASMLSADARKKIDLRYHELGTGYHVWLEEAGIARVLVDPDVARRAAHEPPRGTPAERRGGLVRALAEAGVDARVGWESVRIGRGTVIRLDQRSNR